MCTTGKKRHLVQRSISWNTCIMVNVCFFSWIQMSILETETLQASVAHTEKAKPYSDTKENAIYSCSLMLILCLFFFLLHTLHFKCSKCSSIFFPVLLYSWVRWWLERKCSKNKFFSLQMAELEIKHIDGHHCSLKQWAATEKVWVLYQMENNNLHSCLQPFLPHHISHWLLCRQDFCGLESK